MVVSLIKRLDLKAEPLGALLGIADTRLPDDHDVFRRRSARQRLARAASATIVCLVAGWGVAAWAQGAAPAAEPSQPPPPPLLPLTAISTEQPPAQPELAAPAPAVEEATAVEKPVPGALRRGRGVREQPATPFDAALEMILYSPERRLAIIDGRIAQVGDIVRGATIVDITPTVVRLRDSAGRPRTLGLEGRRWNAETDSGIRP